MNLRPYFIAAVLLTSASPSAWTAESYSFGEGAHGFLVRDYNERLFACLRPIFKDRVRTPQPLDQFGAATRENTRLLQARLGSAGAAAGRAGPAEFAAVGLAWPDDFTRCVNLIDCWEGTFAKLEGSAESEDTFPNVTFGVVGFTSHDGSLQDFLRRADAASNGALLRLARARLSSRDATKFIELVETYQRKNLLQNHQAFVQFAIRNPTAKPEAQQPRPEIARLFAAFDAIPQFREIQLAAARQKCWEEELPDFRESLFGVRKRLSLQADLFCFDMTVLTNGPGEKALQKLAKMPWRSERERMEQIFAAMKTSSEYKDDEEKRADILERERCIINGESEVHDDHYDLRAFGLLPAR
jgi:hypothetical protein